MFEAVFDILSAWSALLYLLAGASVSGIGLLLVGYALYVRVTERAYQGQIIGVRTDAPGQKMYWPLVAYSDERGVRHEVVANSGSSALAGAARGTTVTIFADRTDPASVMLQRDWWILLVLGLFLAAVGAPFIAAGAATLHWTRGTALVLLACAVWGGWKLYNLAPAILAARKNGWAETRKAFMERHSRARHTVAVSDDEISAVLAAETQQTKYALPLLMLFGAGLLIGGALWLRSSEAFIETALAADGVVLRNEESDSSDDTPSYHAVVEFTDRAGNRIAYTDSVGSSPPMYSTGDKVRVFYAPDKSSNAMIDRGFWNWLVPLAVALAGAGLLALGAKAAFTRQNPPQTPVTT